MVEITPRSKPIKLPDAEPNADGANEQNSNRGQHPIPAK
jgi:hypothetical protein